MPSLETVIIGCRLPAGIVLEVGYAALGKNAKNEAYANPHRLDNYQSITLKGWHAHNTTGMQLPAGMNANRPYLNRNIPKDFWEEWKRTHSKSWLLKNHVLFEAKDEVEAQVKATGVAIDGTPKVFMPLAQDKPPPGVETADFQPSKAKAKA